MTMVVMVSMVVMAAMVSLLAILAILAMQNKSQFRSRTLLAADKVDN
ncbi:MULTISPECIES: hypothetical protein [unclassified Colwellia]|nr:MULTISPECIES: hypothetical protein [unclassified Colwellia]MBA6353802.1 hypothetical protein [Colwellia sp. BRX9-1]MBA6356754.1 hypothetical protein [Colwellia sp. BRX8-3]MBA6360367.1 hypothetical protein [Colwellia sp. BRX8-6]MBA6368717.1 hypothetical protein [Colwellia sp. BRX8-5]MBA6374507.1 hypothetical protein [Colwellia sp. BRX8-2]